MPNDQGLVNFLEKNQDKIRKFEDKSLAKFKKARWFKEDELMCILQNAFTANIPLLLDGPPQCGKTAKIKTFCRRIGAECYVIIPSQRDPVEVGGIPFLKKIQVGDTVVTCSSMAPPEKFVELSMKAANGERVVIFIDELRNISPAMQASALGILLGGHVGDFELHHNIRVFAASNDVSHSPFGRPLAPPTASRLCHIFVEDDYNDFINNFGNRWGTYSYRPGWYIPSNQLQEEPIEVVDEIPIRYLEEATSIVLAFLSKHREHYTVQEPVEDKPWAGRRTWDFVSRIIAAALCYYIDNPNEERSSFDILKKDFMVRMVTGLVGKKVEGDWVIFLKQLVTPSPEEMLENPEVMNTIEHDDGLVHLASIRLRGYLENRFIEARQVLEKEKEKKVVDFYKKTYMQAWKVFEWLHSREKLEMAANIAYLLTNEYINHITKLGIGVSIDKADIVKITTMMRKIGIVN